MVAGSFVAFAQTSPAGTAEEARAMLERAVAAVQADEVKALEMFNAEDGGFRDRDLYVFCANATGIETAHPTHRGTKLPDIKDANGFAFGQEIMRTATEDKIGEIAYLWPRPGSETPVEKVTLFTKVGGQICAVGYYK
jgi:signal transduction histidine kinase